MVIDKIKKINPKEPDKKNEKASDMLVGKWVKCNKCKEILYKEDLKNNYSICPNCGQYFRLSSRRRIKQIIDEGTFEELDQDMQTSDLLKFDGYKEKIQTLQEKTKIKEAIQTGTGNINGIKVATLPVTGTISSRYGVSSKIRVSTHTGLDIAATTGTPIKVVADGTVTYAAYSGSYGYLVKVDHGKGVETWYAHTSKMYVKAGQEVKAGDVIAAVGNTGNSTGPHLHLEVRINGKHVNPQKYLYN